MHASSWLIPTNLSVQAQDSLQTRCNPAKNRRTKTIRFVASILTSFLIVLSVTGCESIETVDTNHPLPPKMTATGLAIATKASWQACLADFYKDDWKRMNDHLGRMDELVARWKAEPPPVGHEKEFLATVRSYEEGVANLRKAVEAKNVEGVTDAMRSLGKRVAAFEALR